MLSTPYFFPTPRPYRPLFESKPMPDDRLRTFVTVARCGSLTQAAKELYISQPAVTLQIHRLEEEYGTALFHRRERGVELTPAGSVLLDYAHRIYDLYNSARQDISALSGSLQGTLRLGATLTIGEYVLPPVMGRFKQQCPQVDILLEVENTRRVVDQLASGEFDCGLIEGPFRSGLIRAEKLAEDELVVLCSPEHRLAKKERADLDDVLQEQFIMREPGSGTRVVFENALQGAGVEPTSIRVLMQLGSTKAIKALVQQNLGLSVLSQWTVRDELKEGVLRHILVPTLDLHRSFNLIFLRGVALSRITRRFVRICREHFRDSSG